MPLSYNKMACPLPLAFTFKAEHRKEVCCIFSVFLLFEKKCIPTSLMRKIPEQELFYFIFGRKIIVH